MELKTGFVNGLANHPLGGTQGAQIVVYYIK